MQQDKEPKPAIHFHLEGWQEQRTPTNISVRVTLVGEVQDENIANKVQGKFLGDGMKIYAVDDFKDKMIQVLRQDHKDSEGRVVELENALLSKTREVLALRDELTKIKKTFSFLEHYERAQ